MIPEAVPIVKRTRARNILLSYEGMKKKRYLYDTEDNAAGSVS